MVAAALCAAVVVGGLVMAYEPGRSANAADDPRSTTPVVGCGAHKNSGANLVFADGSNLFDTMNAIRCALATNFELLSLANGQTETCLDERGRIRSIMLGTSSDMVECKPHQLVITAGSGNRLYELEPELRWFVLAASAAQMRFASNRELETMSCVGGYIVAAQPKLSAQKLVESMRQLASDNNDGIDMLLAGIWLHANDKAVSWCVNPSPWHNARAEVVSK
ncbi:MAG TPA: hypothetical protein VM581_00425 [Magnetospirillaceae bacterium]|nr:hypothetical protein [Magnetospirillaceae bacterium]